MINSLKNINLVIITNFFVCITFLPSVFSCSEDNQKNEEELKNLVDNLTNEYQILLQDRRVYLEKIDSITILEPDTILVNSFQQLTSQVDSLIQKIDYYKILLEQGRNSRKDETVVEIVMVGPAETRAGGGYIVEKMLIEYFHNLNNNFKEYLDKPALKMTDLYDENISLKISESQSWDDFAQKLFIKTNINQAKIYLLTFQLKIVRIEEGIVTQMMVKI